MEYNYLLRNFDLFAKCKLRNYIVIIGQNKLNRFGWPKETRIRMEKIIHNRSYALSTIGATLNDHIVQDRK